MRGRPSIRIRRGRESGYENVLKIIGILSLHNSSIYGVRPENVTLKYDQVKFTNLSMYSNGKDSYYNSTSYDYNASLGGQMEKYWDLEQPVPDLVKESSKYYGQQSVNEVVATKIHTMQETDVPFVKYTAEAIPGHGIISHCQAFTSEHVELISAYEILESQKILYAKAGIPEQKAEFISENYKLKLDMMHEFQHGKSISLYHEKEMERKLQYHKPITKQKFLKAL